MSNAASALRGAIWKAGGTWLQVATDLAGVIVMARLIGPEGYGLMGMVLLTLSLLRILPEGALLECLVQRSVLAPGHIDATFWSGMTVACASALLAFVAAGPLANLAGAPGAEPYLQVAVCLLPVSALAAVPRFLLERNLDFRRQAQIGSLTSMASNLVGVAAAFAGCDVWSLLLMEATRSVVPHALVWRHVAWRPALRCRRNHFRDLGGFNALVVSTYVLGNIDRLLPRALIGSLLGPTALGYYLIATRVFDELTRLVCGPLAGICLAAVSRAQADPAVVRRLVEGLYQASMLIALPAFLGFIAVAPIAVPLLFGEAWLPAVTATQILMVCALRTTTSVFNISILRGMGRADLPLWLLGAGAASCAVLLPPLAAFGLNGAMFAIVLRQFVTWPLGILFIRSTTGLPIREQLGIGVTTLLAACVMLIVVACYMTAARNSLADATLLISAVALGAVVYLMSLRVLAAGIFQRLKSIVIAVWRRDDRMLADLPGTPKQEAA